MWRSRMGAPRWTHSTVWPRLRRCGLSGNVWNTNVASVSKRSVSPDSSGRRLLVAGVSGTSVVCSRTRSTHTARHLADVDRIELELDRLRSAGRHPDLWVREHLDRAALGLAAGEELAAWRERSIAEQAARARIDPPDYVRELIGPPPVSGVAFAKRWEELAERLERHRLEYGIDVDRDGPLGSSPGRVSAKDRNRYEQSRELLAGEVERLRADRGMPDDPPVREIVESVHERSVGLGREL